MEKHSYRILMALTFIFGIASCADADVERPSTQGIDDDKDNQQNDGSEEDRTDDDTSTDDQDDKQNPGDKDNGNDEDTDPGDKPDVVDTEVDEESDNNNDVDTAMDDSFPPCANYDFDKKNYDYGSDYAKGPYGFKGSMCWDMAAGQGSWTNYGDVIHNICLPNQDGQEVCLAEFYDAGYDLLIIDVSAIDCPACAAEARDEARLLQKLKQSYWNPVWVTIMGRSLAGSLPKVSTAASWKSQYGSEGHVLADTQAVWEQRMFLDKWPDDERGGVPLTFLVNPKNMVIWDAFAGWTDAANFNEFANYIVDLAVYCSSNDAR